MKNFNAFNTLRQHSAYAKTIGFLAVLSVAVGCGDSKSSQSEGRLLTFDYLGGGSKVIKVYPGVEDTLGDKEDNGTYYDGEEVLAECWTAGRNVESVTSLGELPRASDKWFRIDAEPTQYATAVYVENPEKLLKQLPEC